MAMVRSKLNRKPFYSGYTNIEALTTTPQRKAKSVEMFGAAHEIPIFPFPLPTEHHHLHL